jgi:hypothetical protein
MATCCECGDDIDVDEFDVNRGDQVSCVGCGADLVVFALSPIKLQLADAGSAEGADSADGE